MPRRRVRWYPTALLAVAIWSMVLPMGFGPVAAAGDAAGTPPATDGGDVPMFRGDPAHTGVHPGPEPDGELGVRWRFDPEGMIRYSSPAVVDGTVFVGTTLRLDDAGDRVTG